MFIMSGLSYENIQENSEFKKFVEDIEEQEKDGRLYRIKSEVPTSSMTNWLAMFTGTKPEINGVYGNSVKQKILHFDSVFDRIKAKTEYIKSFVIGSKFFERVLEETIPEARSKRFSRRSL